MIDVGQGALDPRVAPAAVVRGHSHDQRADLGHDGGTARISTYTPIVFLGDKRTVSRQQRVQGHNRGDVSQDAASECLGFRRQSTRCASVNRTRLGPSCFRRTRFSS